MQNALPPQMPHISEKPSSQIESPSQFATKNVGIIAGVLGCIAAPILPLVLTGFTMKKGIETMITGKKPTILKKNQVADGQHRSTIRSCQTTNSVVNLATSNLQNPCPLDPKSSRSALSAKEPPNVSSPRPWSILKEVVFIKPIMGQVKQRLQRPLHPKKSLNLQQKQPTYPKRHKGNYVLLGSGLFSGI